MDTQPHIAAPARSASPELSRISRWVRLGQFLPWLVLAVSLTTTYSLWRAAERTVNHEIQDYFDYRVRDAIEKTGLRLQVYKEVLRGAQGLFKATGKVERKAFKAYVSTLKLADDYPGIQGVGYSMIIPPDAKEKHIAEMRREGFPEYTIKPEGKRALYTSIIYLEPLAERNLRAFGYDMYSEPVRREAMERARDTGLSAMSGKVLLVQEAKQDVQAGFLIYLPVYRNDMPHETLAQRRASLIGWVYSPFRMGDLMRGIYGERAEDLDVHFYDGNEMSDKTLMYDSTNGDNHPSRFTATRHLEAAGHAWTAKIFSRPALESRINTGEPALVAYGGVIASLLLTLLTWALATGRRRAVRLAQDMNRELLTSEQALRNSEAKLQAILDHAAVAIGWADENGKIKYLNHKFTELFGYAIEEIPDVEDWYSRAYPDAAYRESVVPKWQADISAARERGISIPPLNLNVTCKNGSVRHTILSSAWVGSNILVSFSDVTGLKAAEKALQDSKAILQSILDNAPYMIWLKDTKGRILSANRAFVESTGQSRMEEVAGKTDFDFWPLHLAEKYRTDDAMAIATRQQIMQEEQALYKGKPIWMEISRTPVFDAGGHLVGVTGFARDITERKLAEEKVRHQAHYDMLTDLPNRVLFSDRLQQAISTAKRDKSTLAVMFLDLDRFKPVNDLFGHDIGDIVLREVAERIQGCVRESDTVARIGGDEFCILLPFIENEKDATLVAEKVLHALRQSFLLSGHNIHIASSIGIAIYPKDGKDEVMLIKNADIAMYWAKEGGRDSFVLFHPDMPSPVQED